MLLQIAVAPAGTYVKQTSLEDRACLRLQLLTRPCQEAPVWTMGATYRRA